MMDMTIVYKCIFLMVTQVKCIRYTDVIVFLSELKKRILIICIKHFKTSI